MNHLRTTVKVSVVALLIGSCGGSTHYPAPAHPESAVRAFMNAVSANSLVAMGEVWGTERGPAVSFMDRDVLEKRLTIMRSFLVHESYEVLEGSAGALGLTADRRVVEVRFVRQGCMPTVPFTVVRYRAGWLVSDIDLSAAGNPQARCR